MKIEFSTDDNGLLCDVLDSVFVGHLKRQLQNSREYLETSIMQEDKDMSQGVINACLVLLEYYTGETNED